MRGRVDGGDELFSFVRLEERVPNDHPLRAIRALTDEVLASLSERFEGLYARVGRLSIPPDAVAGPPCYKPCSRSARSGC